MRHADPMKLCAPKALADGFGHANGQTGVAGLVKVGVSTIRIHFVV